MKSGLQCLLLSSDEEVVGVLRKVLREIDVKVEHCSDSDVAVQRITRQRYGAVLVDCTTREIAARILKRIHSAPNNKRAVTVAVLQDQPTTDTQNNALKHAFEMGAHFVLFKPISLERTRASFRAVRALMQRERRRHTRIPINVPVEIECDDNQGPFQMKTVDVGEHGIGIRVHHHKMASSFRLRFSLPGTLNAIVGRGEIAWERHQVVGVRFCELDPDSNDELKGWIERQLIGPEKEDLSITCKLTDLTLNACYLQTVSPFPIRTRLQLLMKARHLELQVDGIVRIMHPFTGMGVEFTQNTAATKAKVEKFIKALINAVGIVPDLEVKPDTIDNSPGAFSSCAVPADEDSLLALFHSKADASPELFHQELRKQRSAPAEL